jgi:hypothetical protein
MQRILYSVPTLKKFIVKVTKVGIDTIHVDTRVCNDWFRYSNVGLEGKINIPTQGARKRKSGT